jgi:hypothetical protein
MLEAHGALRTISWVAGRRKFDDNAGCTEAAGSIGKTGVKIDGFVLLLFQRQELKGMGARDECEPTSQGKDRPEAGGYCGIGGKSAEA